jgi:cell division protease FtsH
MTNRSWIAVAIWWIVIAVAIAWSWSSFVKPSIVTSLDYSAFLDDVRSNNVINVNIAGDQLTGSLRNPPQAFQTTFPTTVGDSALLPLLESHGVKIAAETGATPWFVTFAINIVPWLILAALIVWMVSGARNPNNSLSSFGRSNPQQYSSDGQPVVTFADVAGIDEVKEALQEEVDFLRNPRKYRDLGAHIPKWVLLVGPPRLRRRDGPRAHGHRTPT